MPEIGRARRHFPAPQKAFIRKACTSASVRTTHNFEGGGFERKKDGWGTGANHEQHGLKDRQNDLIRGQWAMA